jgi:hypothetical protein
MRRSGTAGIKVRDPAQPGRAREPVARPEHNTPNASKILEYDLALHAQEYGPEPPKPYDLESAQRYSAWWLAWYEKPLRKPASNTLPVQK